MQDIKPGANSVHKAPQKSKTLNRKFTKKPVKSSDKQITVNQSSRKTQARSNNVIDAPRSASISRFAKKPLLKSPGTEIKPIVKKAVTQNSNTPKKTSAKTPARTKVATTEKNAKEKAISKALASNNHQTDQVVKRKNSELNPIIKKRFIKYSGILIALLAVIGGILYFSIPALSIHFASNQAGINATYPREYPEGFSIASTADYKDGGVVIPFKSQDKNLSFNITQSKTIWDSSKLKNETKKISNDNFATTEYKGLTIFHYTLKDKFVTTWINGDILYTISGDVNLDPSQIRAIVDGLS